ncbi:type VI secretion system protein TssL, long form [Agrobacterium radiobacter]|uniref:OmpA-like porin n=1 Tax=Agrobacterium tumefaciens str. B6 TaxID=1183423 RepID=A0A822VBW9_AGRTU|nr:type VI secretion system protein TssL, long form [Agrobacterium tumefaciens]KWT85967.1 cell envelope biogenesis protein OmpA [Agrobacterium tumefaciens str. B6]MQB26137.1 type VI secretion system protein TssL [Agrobacterium tumefaciens]NTA07745.1 type VI secretion system protein TssL [Agrobacterium tumefaciens]NTA94142.1 type VI secretion system protein TssL [Agrobacterium tumefaciens]NTB15349.1 type VI secretion system protein TssL [Agrobacterium tumefaciens]
MSKEKPSSWQDLPTVVEITEESRRRNQNARNMAAILEDIVEADEPAGRTKASAAAMPVDQLLSGFHFGGDDVPTLVQSAAPLLNLAHILRFSDAEPDPDQLRRACVEAITRYERDLASARISPERARAAHYVVCATVDDVVLSKPWGVRAGWARSGLVSTFHNDVTGGDRVFDILDHFHQSPGANKDLLLLIYLCLSLAFEGRTRVSPKGALELSRIRDSLYKTLIGQYGTFERELSPHWKGVDARHTPLRTMAALWTLLSLMALAFALGYLFFTLSLNNASDVTFEKLAHLPPNETPSVLIANPPPQPQAQVETPKVVEPPKTEPRQPSRLEKLMAFLQPEVEKKLVTLADVNGRLRVRINNSGLFSTGSADVSPQFRDLIQRIGGALAAEKFRAVVIGYTDTVPIKTVEFPSNWHLSEARAKAVGDILSQFTGPEAILTEGRADSDPIADNKTEEGRQINRRTEIMVLTNPDEKLSDAGILSPTVQNSSGQQPREVQP